MRGVMDIKGDIRSGENSFFMNGVSKVANGDMNFDLNNSDLSLALINSDFKDLAYMLFQPELFDAKTALDLKYNLDSKQGDLNASLSNGVFIENDFTKTVNKLTKYDLTQDTYEKVTLNSQIDDKKFISDLMMNSTNTQLETTDALLDFEKDIIDARFKIAIKDSNFLIRLKDSMKKPNISLDLTDLLKNKINKKLNKDNKNKIEEKLNKVLKDKDSEKTKKLIKDIKSIF
jgi:hypothetical protein